MPHLELLQYKFHDDTSFWRATSRSTSPIATRPSIAPTKSPYHSRDKYRRRTPFPPQRSPYPSQTLSPLSQLQRLLDPIIHRQYVLSTLFNHRRLRHRPLLRIALLAQPVGLERVPTHHLWISSTAAFEKPGDLGAVATLPVGHLVVRVASCALEVDREGATHGWLGGNVMMVELMVIFLCKN